MSDETLRPNFWELPLTALSRAEWEALCDGCGLCCLNKLEDEDTGEVALTCVACQLLDNDTAQCARYETRHEIVPECIVLTPETLKKHLYWLPETCAYVRRLHGQPLPDWHPVLTGSPEAMHRGQHSVAGKTVSELQISDEDWEEYVVGDGFPEGA